MLIKRTVVQENPVPETETNVTVVRPERNTGLLAGLGIATILAVAAIAYLSWYLPNQQTYETPVATQPVDSGRAERFENPAPKPNTVIVNPPPVIQTPPPVVTSPPIVVTPPQHTVIVPGSSSPAPDRNNNSSNSNRNSNDTSSDNGNSGSNSNNSDMNGSTTGG